MILSALNNLYERTVGTEGGPPPTGYAEVPVVGALDIGEAGELLQLQDLRREVSVGNKTRLLPARRAVPQTPIRTSTAIRAGFLYDNAPPGWTTRALAGIPRSLARWIFRNGRENPEKRGGAHPVG
jgi:hypothetical protein